LRGETDAHATSLSEPSCRWGNEDRRRYRRREDPGTLRSGGQADPEKVLHWLRQQGPLVGAELTRLADKVLTAVHHDEWPLLWDVSQPPRGVRMQLYCHAIRPVTLRQLATILRDVRDRWEDILSLLPTTRAVSA
jgi:hypothetical protein